MAAPQLIAIGKLSGPWATLYADYAKRLRPALTLHEGEAPKGLSESAQNAWESKWLLAQLPASATLIALDKAGKTYESAALAAQLARWQALARPLVFVLGGANGLDSAILARAHAKLSFGPNTWPHLLCRVMLLEQLYRAQCISAGHPYHK